MEGIHVVDKSDSLLFLKKEIELPELLYFALLS